MSELLLQTVSPMALEVALAVADELAARAEEADRLRRTQVERARHTAELARRRYLAVDPDNRLVAASLEADWNQALRDHTRAQEDYERQAHTASTLSQDQRAKVLALASDFPALWNDPRTPQRERKRMVRLLLADVTLLRGQAITAHVRFVGGPTRSLTLPAPQAAPDLRRTPPAVIAQIDRLLDEHTDAEVAQALNRSGIASGTGQPFHDGIVCHIRRSHRLASRKDRLQARGMVGARELANRLGVCTTTIKQWAAEGRLRSEVFNDKGERLYEIPDTPPFKKIGRPPTHLPKSCRTKPRRCSVQPTPSRVAPASASARLQRPPTGTRRRSCGSTSRPDRAAGSVPDALAPPARAGGLRGLLGGPGANWVGGHAG